MTKKTRPGTAREDFVAAVLTLIDNGLGFRDLNLRRVARQVGCAHTNAYNYFSSWEELLWFSLEGAMEGLLCSAGLPHNPGSLSNPELLNHIRSFPGPGEKGNLFEVYVDFAYRHPGWYRLIWLDPMGGKPPEEILSLLHVPSRLFGWWLEHWMTPPYSVGTSDMSGDEHPKHPQPLAVESPKPEPAEGLPPWVLERGRILHGYMHGELANMVTGRSPELTSPGMSRILIARIMDLYTRLNTK